MNRPTKTLLYTQAELGAAIWIAYWLTEYVNSQVLSIFSTAHTFHTIWDASFVGFLFVFYGTVGISIGLACGFFIHLLRCTRLLPAHLDPFAVGFVFSAGSVLLAVSGSLYHRIPLDAAQYLTLTVLGLIVLASLFSPQKSIAPNRILDTGGILIVALWLTGILLSAFRPPARCSAADIALFGTEWLALSVFFARLLHVRSRHLDAPGPSRTLATLCVAISFLAAILFVELLRIPSTDYDPISSTGEKKNAGLPNVLMIVLDTVRADHLGVYGYFRDTTPYLTEFAKESVIYDFVVSPGDMTLSAHGAIFTGLYARETGAHFDSAGVGQPLRTEFTTIAEILRASGYRTGGIVSNVVFFGKDFGLEQGFEYFDVRPSDEYSLYKALGHVDPLYLRKAIHEYWVRDVPPSKLDREFRSAEQITADALGFIDSHAKTTTPFFLFLNYMDSHWRYLPPHPYDSLYPGKIQNFTRQTYHELIDEVTKKQAREIRAEERQHLVSQYDGSINYSDAHIGKILDRLKETKLFDDMLIIVTSDHGEAFGSRHLLQHAVSAYQNQLRVPLIIHYPGGRPHGHRTEWVSTLDILPTILASTGNEIPEGLPGIDLKQKVSSDGRFLVGESYSNRLFLGPRFDRIERAIYRYPYKLIRSSTGKKELYDLTRDPEEKHNVYHQQQAVAEQLNERLDHWLLDTPNHYQKHEESQPDEKTLERLRALGYID